MVIDVEYHGFKMNLLNKLNKKYLYKNNKLIIFNNNNRIINIINLVEECQLNLKKENIINIFVKLVERCYLLLCQ